VLAPVVLGEGVIIHERVKIGLGIAGGDGADSRRSSIMSTTSARDSVRGEGTLLGKNAVVETGAVVEAAEIGEGSVVEVGATIGRGCVVGKYCTISAATTLPPNTHIPEYTVVYCGSERRIDKTLRDRPEVLHAKLLMHSKQLDMFKKLVPNNVAKWT
jgi:dynactin-6